MLYLVGMPIVKSDVKFMPQRNLELLRNAKYLVAENEESFYEINNVLNLDSSTQIFFIGKKTNSEKVSNEPDTLNTILNLLSQNEDVYLISDDGMPGIGDPGEYITKEAIKNGYEVSATPGPSSIISAVSIAGCQNNFSFESFLVKEPDGSSLEMREKILNKKYKDCPMVFLIRSYPISLDEEEEIIKGLSMMLKEWGDRKAVLCYSLTTSREKAIRGNISSLIKYHKENIEVGQYPVVMLIVDGRYPMLPMPNLE